MNEILLDTIDSGHSAVELSQPNVAADQRSTLPDLVFDNDPARCIDGSTENIDRIILPPESVASSLDTFQRYLQNKDPFSPTRHKVFDLLQGSDTNTTTESEADAVAAVSDLIYYEMYRGSEQDEQMHQPELLRTELAKLTNDVWHRIASKHETPKDFIESLPGGVKDAYLRAVLLNLEVALRRSNETVGMSYEVMYELCSEVNSVRAVQEFFGDSPQHAEVNTLLEEIEKRPDVAAYSLYLDAYEYAQAKGKASPKHLVETYREKLHQVLALNGFKAEEAEDVISSWATCISNKKSNIFLDNVESLAALAAHNLSYPARAHREYRIRNFGRYVQGRDILLLPQLKGFTFAQDIAVLPYADHNGASSNELDSLNAKTAREFMYFEAKNIAEIANAFKKFKEDTHRLPRRAVLSAHGTKKAMYFGGSREPFNRRSMRLLGYNGKIDVFQTTGDITLMSCSTGKSGGIGEFLARQLQVDVYAPNSVSGSRLDKNANPVHITSPRYYDRALDRRREPHKRRQGRVDTVRIQPVYGGAGVRRTWVDNSRN